MFFLWVYTKTMIQEEEVLEEFFGADYVAYRQAVPRLFLRLSPYRPDRPDYVPAPFSLNRYLRNKEWEAALGAAAGFAFLAAKSVFGF